MKIVETAVFSFNELSEEAKQKAINNYRENDNYMGYDWYSFIYEEYEEIVNQAGFDEVKFYFSGFWSQGDGAMFEYKGINDKLRLEFIETLGLSDMRKGWLINNTMVSGHGRQQGHYYHENSCWHSIYYEIDNGDLHYTTNFHKWLETFSDGFEEFVIEKYKAIAQEFYRALEKEWDYQNSDEVVTQMLIDNEYDFTSGGKIF
jgi:hypothetical protein